MGNCGSLWGDGMKAEQLHNYFIDNYHKFITYNYDKGLIRINSRFSIIFSDTKVNTGTK